MNKLFFGLIVFWSLSMLSQTEDYSLLSIPDALKNRANSVVRLDDFDIEIPDISTIDIRHKRIVTVLNKNGNDDTDSYIYYDEVSRVKDISVTIYNAIGKEVKKFKKRDFVDVSATDGFSLHTDSRLLYLEYTPTSYPYTMVVESEKTSSNTAHIPSLYMNSGYYSSTQKIQYKITYDQSLGLRFNHVEGDNKKASITNDEGVLTVNVDNVLAMAPEAYSPSFIKKVEHINFGLDKFNLEGVNGEAQSWQTFGKWMDDYLLKGTEELPEGTIAMVKQMVDGIDDPMERAQKVYEYMQDKTRYVSIQIGIGGWKPMEASRVDEVGYGDCKALSMYTKSLLDVAQVPSYYTVVYGDKDKRDIQEDFPSMQGNHVILTLPKDDSYVWLECTSQQAPFGFIAGFTDDRDVLIVTPEGGEIVHTKKYTPEENYQKIDGTYQLLEDGSIEANVSIISGGTQYGSRMTLDHKKDEKQKEHYYRFWDYLSNPKLSSIDIKNDKDEIKLIENVTFSVSRYGTFAGEEMIVPVNVFNRFTSIPSRIKEREQEVTVSRGFLDADEVRIKIPETYEVSILPEAMDVKTPYGTYKQSIEKVSDAELVYKRELKLNEGTYEKDAYTAFRKFFRRVSKSDQSKMILLKK